MTILTPVPGPLLIFKDTGHTCDTILLYIHAYKTVMQINLKAYLKEDKHFLIEVTGVQIVWYVQTAQGEH